MIGLEKTTIKLISVFAIILLSVFLIIAYYSINQKPKTAVTINEEKSQSLSKIINFSNFNAVFRFRASIPFDWQVDYIPQINAINIYNPNVTAEDKLEKSQIFIRYFESTKFLTLNTVDFFLKEPAVVMDREAMRYEIQKRPSVPNFSYQPSWRNTRHKLIDIRFSKSSPSIFYVFAYNPELPASDFDKFINSIEFYEEKKIPVSDLDILGKGGTKETDFERKHFSVLKNLLILIVSLTLTSHDLLVAVISTKI